jgi:hypothetical protein
MRGSRNIVGSSSHVNNVIAGCVFVLASAVAYTHWYLPHHSDLAAEGRERAARDDADASSPAFKRGGSSTWSNMAKKRDSA